MKVRQGKAGEKSKKVVRPEEVLDLEELVCK